MSTPLEKGCGIRWVECSFNSKAIINDILGKVNTGKELAVFEDQGYWLKVAYNGQFAFSKDIRAILLKMKTSGNGKASRATSKEPVETEKPAEQPANRWKQKNQLSNHKPVETEKPTEQPAQPVEIENQPSNQLNL